MNSKTIGITFIIVLIVLVLLVFLMIDNSMRSSILEKDANLKEHFDNFDWNSNNISRIDILDFFEEYIHHTIKSIGSDGLIKKKILNSKEQKSIYEGLVIRIKKIRAIAFEKDNLSDKDFKKIVSYISGETRDTLEYYLKLNPKNETVRIINSTWNELVEPSIQVTEEEIISRRIEKLRESNETWERERKARKKKTEKIQEISVLENLPPKREPALIKKKIYTVIPMKNAKSYIDENINIQMQDGRSFSGKLIKVEDEFLHFEMTFSNGNISMKLRRSEIKVLNEIKEVLVEDK